MGKRTGSATPSFSLPRLLAAPDRYPNTLWPPLLPFPLLNLKPVLDPGTWDLELCLRRTSTWSVRSSTCFSWPLIFSILVRKIPCANTISVPSTLRWSPMWVPRLAPPQLVLQRLFTHVPALFLPPPPQGTGQESKGNPVPRVPLSPMLRTEWSSELGQPEVCLKYPAMQGRGRRAVEGAGVREQPGEEVDSAALGGSGALSLALLL